MDTRDILIIALAALWLAYTVWQNCRRHRFTLEIIEMVTSLTAEAISLRERIKNAEKKIDEAAMGKDLGEISAELDKFKERFESAIAEAEKQNDIEARWNEGLNNILNYNLIQAFEAGKDKK